MEHQELQQQQHSKHARPLTISSSNEIPPTQSKSQFHHHHHYHHPKISSSSTMTETQRPRQQLKNSNNFRTVQQILSAYMKRLEQQKPPHLVLQPYQVAFVWSNLRKAVQQQQQKLAKTWHRELNNNDSTSFWTIGGVQTLSTHSMQLVHDWNGRSTATVTHSLAKLLDLTTTGSGGGMQNEQQCDNSSIGLVEALWNALLVRSEILFEASSSTASSRDNNFKAVEVSNLWWAYAKVASISLSPPPELLLVVLTDTSLGCVNEFSPQGLSNITWAIATLNTHRHPAVQAAASQLSPTLSTFLNVIAQAARVHVYRFDAQQLSNLMWAFAKLNHDDKSLSALVDAATNRIIHSSIIHTFTPQNLANTAWAFAKFRKQHQWRHSEKSPLPLLVDVIAGAARARIGQFKALELSTLAWAFATFQHQPQHSDKSPLPLSSLFDDIAQAAQARIGEFKARQLSSLAWAFANVKHTSHQTPALFHAIARAAQGRMNDFNPQALSITAWAFASLNHEAPSLLDAIAERARWQIQHFDPQALANTAYAFAKVNYADPALFHVIAKAARWRIYDFKPQELVNLTWAFATLNYKDPLLLNDIAAAAENASWSNFTVQGMANMAWSFAVFNHVGESNINNNSSSLMTDPNSSYAQTLLSLLNDDSASSNSDYDSAFSIEHLCQFYQFGLWCKERNAITAAADVDWFPTDLSRRCKQAFMSIEAPAASSLLQKDVVATLATLPDVSDVKVEVLTEIGYRLDAVVTFRGNFLIGIEVDGPTHDGGKSQSPNGRTTLKHRQLRSLEGWALVSVPYWEWNKILENSDGQASMKLAKQRYLLALLDQAVQQH
jgi:RAP domain